MRLKLLLLLIFFTYAAALQAQWAELGTGSAGLNANDSISSIAIDGSGNVYAAGGFTDDNGKPYVAKWNGASWAELGAGLNANAAIYTVTTDRAGNVYAAGAFTNGNGKCYVAKWNGTNWAELGAATNALNANGAIYSVVIDGAGNVYASGKFKGYSGNYYVAKWNGTNWAELGTGSAALNANGAIYTIAIDGASNVYAAGAFTDKAGVYIYGGYKVDSGNCYVAKWNGTMWAELGPTGGGVGQSTTPVDVSYFPGQKDSLGTGQINSIVVDALGNVYAGGVFTNSATGDYYVTKWNGTSWTGVLNLLYSPIYSIAVDVSGNIYAEGTNTNDGTPHLQVVKWNGTKQVNVGNAASYFGNTTILSLAVDTLGNVYAGGWFTDGNGKQYVAKFEAPPLPTVNSPVTYCKNAAAIALTATATAGATLNWYGTNANGGTASSTAPTPSTVTPGSTIYYVSQTLGDYESERVGIVITIDTIQSPAQPTITTEGSTTICNNDNVLLITPTVMGLSYQWYNGGAAISGATGSSYTATAAGSYTETATSPNNCSATSAGVTVTVKIPYYNIKTIAGDSARGGGYSGNGGAATLAQLQNPTGVVVDGLGNLYIADAANNVIRKVNASTGIISAVAGDYLLGIGYSGDESAATSAQFHFPTSIVFDIQGNLYIADHFNNVVRKVTASTGIITTIAGDSALGGGYSGDGKAAALAQLNGPSGIAVDGQGNVYIADANNNVIRKVNASTGIISTIAGNYTKGAGYSGDGGAATSAQLNGPLGLAVDAQDNIYIADVQNSVIRKVNASTGIIGTIVGDSALGSGYSGDGGAATSAKLNGPFGVAVDGQSNIYIADFYNNAIRKVTAPTGIISTIAGDSALGAGYSGDGGAATSAKLNGPYGVTVDGQGNVYIAEYYNNVVRKLYPHSISVPTILASGPLTFCAGNSITLTANDATAGLSYQWYNGDTAISGATNTTYSATAAGNYTVTVNSGSCSSTSAPTTVNVIPLPLPPTATSPVTYCQGDTALALTATGSSLLWYTAAGGVGSSKAPTPSTSAGLNFNYPIGPVTTNYYVTQTVNGCESPRDTIKVIVNPTPGGPEIQPGLFGSNSNCSGGIATFGILAAAPITLPPGAVLTYVWSSTGATVLENGGSGGYGPYQVQWLYGTSEGYIGLATIALGCTGSVSAVNVPLYAPPANIAPAGSASFCMGDSLVLNADTGTGLGYQWNAGGSAISGATGISYTATAAGSYTVTVTVTQQNYILVCSDTSAAVTVTVDSLPSVSIAGNAQYITTTTALLSANTPTVGTGIWSVVSGTAFFADSALAVTTVNNLSAGANVLQWKTTNGICSDSSTVTINVGATPVPQIISGPDSVSANQIGIVYSVPDSSGLTYHWTLPAGATITGANADSSSIIINFADTSGTVSVTQTNPYGSATSTLAISVSSATTGIIPGAGGDYIQARPNPFSDYTTIIVHSATTEPLTLTALNVQGVICYSSSQYFTNQEFTVGSELTADGVYVVQLAFGSEVTALKLVKIK